MLNYSNIKTDSTLLKLADENLVCRTCISWRQHMRVPRPLKVDVDYSLLYVDC